MQVLESTPEQKEKYEIYINSVYRGYDSLINKINKILLSYGEVFFKGTQNILTHEYVLNKKKETKEEITNLSQKTFISAVEELKEYKEKYLNECFPMTSTDDSLELDFISRELAVMNSDELKQFYLENMLDKNKVRLFDIELKKRLNSNDNDAQLIKLFKDEFTIEDSITKKIDERIKYFDGLRQISISSLALIKSLNGSTPEIKMLSFDEVFRFVEGKSSMNKPDNINIIELLS